jgi:hypothetical protein
MDKAGNGHSFLVMATAGTIYSCSWLQLAMDASDNGHSWQLLEPTLAPGLQWTQQIKSTDGNRQSWQQNQLKINTAYSGDR